MSPTHLNRRALLATTARGAATLTTAALAASLLGACASKPEVRHDRDTSVDLKTYRTFAFDEGHDERGPRRGSASYSTLQETRLRQATSRQLEQQGFVPAAGEPDLRVHLTMKVVNRQELRSTPALRGIGLRGVGGTQIDTADVRQGTLVIDLVDTRRNALVWRGVAEGAIERGDAADPGGAIERAVAEVFAGFKR
ncbi:MAG: DUF4136 domain-containing protein [Rubrivivax sp.]|nr:DUF4136 domain-containing protein [Rubrivivax sp.]